MMAVKNIVVIAKLVKLKGWHGHASLKPILHSLEPCGVILASPSGKE